MCYSDGFLANFIKRPLLMNLKSSCDITVAITEQPVLKCKALNEEFVISKLLIPLEFFIILITIFNIIKKIILA